MSNPCTICGSEGARKVRLDILPWLRKCVFICSLCVADLPRLIQEIRDAELKS